MRRLLLFAATIVIEAACATMAIAEDARSKNVAAQDSQIILQPVDRSKRNLIAKQDLFDRGNPNNFRSDLPAPPAQPGQR